MDNWIAYTFGEAVNCNPKFSFKKGEMIENCEMEDIQPDFKFLYPQGRKIYKGSNSKFQNEDTVFARITPCLENGKIAQIKGLIDNKGIGSTEFFVFRGKENYTTNDFVYYLSKSNLIRDTAVNSMTGASGRQRADIKAIKSLVVKIPSCAVQDRITAVLSAYDNLIETNNQRLKILDETAQQLYREWFVRLRFPGFEKIRFVKGLPEWRIVPLSEIANITMGQSPKSEFYNDNGDGLPFHQGVGTYGLRFPDHVTFCSKLGRTAETGSILFSVRAPVGRLNIADRKIIIGRGIAAINHKNELNNYLYYLLQNEFSNEDMIGNGSIFNSVGKDELREFKIFDVGELAKEFDKLVAPISNQINILYRQNAELRQTRDRLMPRLISGKLLVKDFNLSNAVSIRPHFLKSNSVNEIASKEKGSNKYFKRAVLAAYVVDHLHEENTFGHVKLMKLMYLCEHVAHIETISNYHRDAAGPYDNQMIRSIDSQLKKQQWFQCKNENGRYVYYTLAKKEKYKEWFGKYFSEEQPGIDQLIELFGKRKTEEVEIVATLLEAHRHLQTLGKVTDALVVNEVLNNWHNSKKRIEEKRWREGLVWMRQRNWIP